ncbi:MAG: riboflavin biosynthesis protein RibF [Rubripirellula sp.]|nr:riboflavin biosynthesis protein RibF [Rubripirellula sp.]
MTDIVSLRNIVERLEAGLDSAVSESSHDAYAAARNGVITIGNFDGVHRGHATLLHEVRTLADQLGGPAVAVILDPHPVSILRPEAAPQRLSWIERRAEKMDSLGIDCLVVCETTREFLRMTADQFFDSLVVERLAAKAMVEGPNFFFGRDRGGDVRRLGALCQEQDLRLRIVDATQTEGQMISSTRIRGLLIEGRVEEAADLLEGPHRIRGTVVQGDQRGRSIGFPTANLDQIDVVVPAAGVYGGVATAAGQTHYAAIHIGPNLTFEPSGSSKVEIHLLDFEGDLYGDELQVDFMFKLRDIARFDSAEVLVRQLRQDVDLIRDGLTDRLSRLDSPGRPDSSD